jgi:hypothetical protein
MSALLRITDLTRKPGYVRKVPILLQESFWGGRTKFLRAADASYERRRKGPYRFIQN